MERKFDYSGQGLNSRTFKNSNTYKVPCDMVKTASAYSHSANFKYVRPVKNVKVQSLKTVAVGDIVNPSSLTFRSLNKAQIDLNEK